MSFTFMFNKMYLIVRLFNEILIKTAFNDDLTNSCHELPLRHYFLVHVSTEFKYQPL